MNGRTYLFFLTVFFAFAAAAGFFAFAGAFDGRGFIGFATFLTAVFFPGLAGGDTPLAAFTGFAAGVAFAAGATLAAGLPATGLAAAAGTLALAPLPGAETSGAFAESATGGLAAAAFAAAFAAARAAAAEPDLPAAALNERFAISTRFVSSRILASFSGSTCTGVTGGSNLPTTDADFGVLATAEGLFTIRTRSNPS